MQKVYTKIESIVGNVITVKADGVRSGDMGQIAPKFAHDKNVVAYTKVDDIIKTYINFVGRSHELFNAAMEALYTEYDSHDANHD